MITRILPPVTEGMLAAGLPYLRFGHGPPLVMALGGSARHANPAGLMRYVSLSTAAPFARHFTVYLVSRRSGLAPGCTISDIADDYARAIEDDIGEPVLLHGISAGGAVALQLAIGYPHLVRRLVLAPAACRLSPPGTRMMADVARLAGAGDPRRAAALLAGKLAPRPLRHAAGVLAWLANPLAADDPSDMLITNAAMRAYDAEPCLHLVRAPTLIVGGSADPYYSEGLFRRTAAGIPDGHVIVFPGKGHLYVAGSRRSARTALDFVLSGDPQGAGA